MFRYLDDWESVIGNPLREFCYLFKLNDWIFILDILLFIQIKWLDFYFGYFTLNKTRKYWSVVYTPYMWPLDLTIS